jgi:putative oxidoreductase
MFKNSFLNWIASIYKFFIKIGSHLQSLFLLYMRITWGHQFFILGLAKLGAIEHMGELFHSLAIPAPTLSVYLVAFIEIICGFMLFIGLASRIAALPLIIIMLVALSTAHAPNLSELRFLLQPLSLVRELPYPFLITALLVFIFGPGKISVDAVIKKWSEKHSIY